MGIASVSASGAGSGEGFKGSEELANGWTEPDGLSDGWSMSLALQIANHFHTLHPHHVLLMQAQRESPLDNKLPEIRAGVGRGPKLSVS